ncbi:MAG: hypothetical protein KTR16_11430 [Acidiferrobacterales bacterium]|nr:hypothetical protein [Acidiferrobacterales bacterium]
MQPHHENPNIKLSKKIGVFYSSHTKTWSAHIRVGGDTKILGFYESEDIAIRTRIQAEIKYGYRVCHGMTDISAAERKRRENKILSYANESGYKGIIWYKDKKKWATRQHVNGKRLHLGYFDYLDDAIIAKIKAEREKYR